MQALYRAGRQADALAAYRRIRTLLHDEPGAEPVPSDNGYTDPSSPGTPP